MLLYQQVRDKRRTVTRGWDRRTEPDGSCGGCRANVATPALAVGPVDQVHAPIDPDSEQQGEHHDVHEGEGDGQDQRGDLREHDGDQERPQGEQRVVNPSPQQQEEQGNGERGPDQCLAE